MHLNLLKLLYIIVNPDRVKRAFLDVTITSALRRDMLIYGESFLTF